MLIIRKGKNRALAFNAVNGRQLALDSEGGSVLVEYLNDNNKVGDRSFLIEVFDALGVESSETFRVIEEKKTVNERPFEVLDAPVLVDVQITTKCNLACPHCYANAVANGYHLPLEDVKKIIDQSAELGVFEIALGGGEPTLHPDFENILKYAREKGIVPNLATNGFELSDQTILAIARYAGAVALSVEFIGDDFKRRRGFEFDRWLKNYQRLRRTGVRIVFQLTVSRDNLPKMDKILEYLYDLKPYGIIFLTFKPYGRGENFDQPLSTQDFSCVTDILKKVIVEKREDINLGYDCCLGNALVGIGLIGDEQIKGCSALRSSLAVNANMEVVPCSFSAATIGNLKSDNLNELWYGRPAENWRDNFQAKIDRDNNCSSCGYKNNCVGGCPEFDLVGCYRKKS